MMKKVVSQCISADYCKGWNDAVEEMEKEIEGLDRERCKNCKHFIPCKELVNRYWKWFHICDLFAREEGGFALVVEENGLCEEFSDVSEVRPTVEAKPNVHGHWINDLSADWKCSACGFNESPSKHYHYCPNCGAKMSEVEE